MHLDRGAWQAAVHGVTKSDMTEHAHMHSYIYKRDKQQGPTYCIAQ